MENENLDLKVVKIDEIVNAALENFIEKYPEEEYEWPSLLDDYMDDPAKMIRDFLNDDLPFGYDLEDMLIYMGAFSALDAVRAVRKGEVETPPYSSR